MHSLMTENNQNETSDKTNTNGRKRRLRRVKSLIKSSIESLTNEDDNEQTNKRSSTNGSHEKRPFPFGRCRVCSDKATGAHYGVPTCEGCKVR